MSTPIIMPQMGESIAEGTITKWFKKQGDRVDRDEPLFEISTDKVDTEIPSPAAGVLTEIKVGEGQTVPINTVVGIIGAEGAAVGASSQPLSSTQQMRAVSPGPPAPEPEPSAPSPEARAPRRETGEPRSSPLVRRMAREQDIDLTRVRGTGAGGRISKKDLVEFMKDRDVESPAAAVKPRITAAEEPPTAPAPPAPTAAAPSIAQVGRVRSEPMSVMRRSIAEHMILSRRTSAHVSTVWEADMTIVDKVRKENSGRFEKEEGVKLTYMPFFLRAVLHALKAYPIVNSSVEGNNILYKRDLNIGVAVALENGLIVPVIHRADEKSFLGLQRAVNDLATRARDKKLKPEDVQGGTFTITNPGPFGALFGTPIINQPQVAILGLGAIHKRPVVVNDAIAVRSMVYMSLTFDHRIIDGAVADQFMAEVRKRLESWDEKIL
jgi:2-oxoglutarate dehydrogenase E2 component (dihydrolipoamide succinyltransferase)